MPLSAEQRSQRASNAARKRWSTEPTGAASEQGRRGHVAWLVNSVIKYAPLLTEDQRTRLQVMLTEVRT